MSEVKYQPPVIRSAMRKVADVMLDALMPALQTLARTHGYAVAVHGSLSRDIDLVFVPWKEEVSDPAELVDAIKAAIASVIGPCYFTGGTAKDPKPKPTPQPHGRLSWSIITSCGGGLPYFDISVFSPSAAAEAKEGATHG